jgi:hypothetical protein
VTPWSTVVVSISSVVIGGSLTLVATWLTTSATHRIEREKLAAAKRTDHLTWQREIVVDFSRHFAGAWTSLHRAVRVWQSRPGDEEVPGFLGPVVLIFDTQIASEGEAALEHLALALTALEAGDVAGAEVALEASSESRSRFDKLVRTVLVA